MATKTTKTEETVEFVKLSQKKIELYILGRSPLICNRLSNKVKQELLSPKGRKTTAEKAGSLKHNPLEEFRNSPYLNVDPEGATYIEMLSSMIKKGMMTGALETPGAKMAQVGRLVYVENDRIPIFGIPKIFLSVTRSADMNKTPDVRSRAIIPKWASILQIRYVSPTLNDQMVANLVSAAGIVSGMGDWRIQKGSGNYGTFEIVNPEDPEFAELISTCGRSGQVEAMENPDPYDSETEELLSWFDTEVKRRGIKVV